jgi:N-dimethylarginine dimethylaminohydrolase
MGKIFSEVDVLKSVILCRPTLYRSLGEINGTMEFWKRMRFPINTEEAMIEHGTLIDTLTENSVKSYFVEPSEEFQVFTRDAGVCLENRSLLVARMKPDVRKNETQKVIEKAKEINWNYEQIPADLTFEGGDLICFNKNLVFLGVGGRTSPGMARFLEEKYRVRVVPVKLGQNIVHLDVAMNFPSREWVVLDPESVPRDMIKILKEELNLNLMMVDRLYQFTLATNFLPLKSGRIVTAVENHEINQRLEKEGIDVLEIPYREMIKSGGSVRCSTLPLEKG